MFGGKDHAKAARELDRKIKSGEATAIPIKINALDAPSEGTPNSVDEAIRELKPLEKSDPALDVLGKSDAMALHEELTGREEPLAGEEVIVAIRKTDQK